MINSFNNQKGAALMETAISLLLFAALLYGLDYLGTTIILRNQALSYQHHLTMISLREAESCDTVVAPLPKNSRLVLKNTHENRKKNFEGTDMGSVKPGRYTLIHMMRPNFSAQSEALLALGPHEMSHTTHAFRDPWNDNYLYIAGIWAYALSKASGGKNNEIKKDTESLAKSDLGPKASSQDKKGVANFLNILSGDSQVGSSIMKNFSSRLESESSVTANKMKEVLEKIGQDSQPKGLDV